MSQQISIGQIIDKTFHVYQKHFLAYAKHGMWLFVTLPLSILILEPIVHLFSDNIFTIAIIVAIAMLVNFVVAIIMGNFVSNGFIFATDAFDKEKTVTQASLQKSAWSRLGAACGQSVVLFVILALAALLLIPGLGLFMSSSYTETPGVVLPALGMFLLFAGGVAALVLIVWFAVIFPFAPMKLIVERQGVFASIKGAFALVRGRWLATAVRVLIPKIVFGVIVAFVQIVVVFFFYVITAAMVPVSELIGESTAAILIYILQTAAVLAVTALTTPAFVIADYYVYRDLVATRNAS